MSKARLVWSTIVAAVLLAGSATGALAQGTGESRLTLILFFFAITGVLFFPMGAWFILRHGKGLALAKASKSWPTVGGTVIKSEVESSIRLSNLFRSRSDVTDEYKHVPVVRYRYGIGAKQYENDTVWFGLIELPKVSADKLVQDYPVGAAVTVHYDPQDPQTSTLDLRTSYGRANYWAGWFMIAVPVLVAGGIYALLR